MAEPLHNVSFQAARTNSSPPPPTLPYHIEQGLRGEVGTTRLPSDLSRVSRFLGKFITILVSLGVLWVFRHQPLVGVILAIGVAGLSSALSGLHFGIPYLQQRREDWTASNWWLLRAAMFVVWIALVAIAYQLVFNTPQISAQIEPWLRSLADNNNKVRQIEHDLWLANHNCVYRCESWRSRLETKLADARKEQTAWRDWFSDSGSEADDDTLKDIAFVALAVVLGIVVGIAAYGPSLSSETANAIWREPHTGYTLAVPSKPQDTPKPADDPEATRVFNAWLGRCVKMDPAQSVKLDDAYGKYRGFCVSNKSAPLSVDAFKTRMKSDAGIEPVNGIYQGVAIGEGII